MPIQPLDETKLFALMAAGAIFALAGLYLLLRRPSDAEAARIELFGLKLQAASAGLVVFLIGAALLASPLVVPAVPSDPVQSTSEGSGTAAGGPSGGTSVAGVPGGGARTVHEREPNNSSGDATPIGPGTVFGSLQDGDGSDWYAFTPDPAHGDTFQVAVRPLKGSLNVMLRDDQGRLQELFMLTDVGGPDIRSLRVKFPTYLVEVSSVTSTSDYEIEISYP